MPNQLRPRVSCGLPIALCLLLGACASTAPSKGDAANNSAAGARVVEAASTPLDDLNIVRADIPAVLQAARKSAYAQPAASGCEVLTKEVAELDAVLGADLDVPATDSNPGLIERGRDEVGNAAVGALRSTAEGLIPFRGWVRKLTGAESHAKEVAASIAAGVVRRAYLKGLGQSAGCAVPASPNRPLPAQTASQ